MNTSPQFVRTDRAIIQALIRLLKQKPFERITVQDILDETPVTRATFYAHFKDKYHVAERMQEEFLALLEEIIQQFHTSRKSQYPAIIRSAQMMNQELAQALLKIHTDTVDIPRILAKRLETEYLRTSDSPARTAEAYVYSQTMVALQMSYFLPDNVSDHSESYFDDLVIATFLRILHLDTDEKIKQELYLALKRTEK